MYISNLSFFFHTGKPNFLTKVTKLQRHSLEAKTRHETKEKDDLSYEEPFWTRSASAQEVRVMRSLSELVAVKKIFMN